MGTTPPFFPGPGPALASWAVLTAAGTLLTWLVLRAGLQPAGREVVWAVVPVALAGVLALTVVLVGWWVLPRRRADSLVLAAGSVLLGGTAMTASHGTAWGLDGLYSDAGFRTQMVTRYADSPALADYGYAGLTAYYPPLWPWLQGRAAALLDVPGWTVMRPAQILVCLVLPVLTWLLWRRVCQDLTAAWVASAVTLGTALAHKPDEWLVLCLLLPWWLEVCRGVVRPDVARWGFLRHGVVLGLLLLTHTYFFVPLALATLAGLVSDAVRRRPLRPAPLRAVAIGAVGLVVSAPTWWYLLAGRLAGTPTDDLQRRWSPTGFDGPALPIPWDARGVVELVGVVWLLLAFRRSRLASALLLVLVTSYVFMVGGQLLQAWDVALLPEKTEELSEAVLVAAGVLGAREAVHGGWATWSQRWGRRTVAAAVVVLVLAAAAAAAGSLARGVAEPARPAQTMRYPDGGFPAGGPVPGQPNWHPWGVAPGAGRASVSEVETAWRATGGGELEAGLVLVSARADVPAVLPVHLFASWKSIYSHPHGQFEARLEVLRRLEACTDPDCAYRVLRENEVEAVDGLLLNTDDRGYYLSVAVDDFPDEWVRQRVSLDPELFDAPQFEVVELDSTAVVRVVP